MCSFVFGEASENGLCVAVESSSASNERKKVILLLQAQRCFSSKASTKIQAVQAFYSYFSMAQWQSGRPFTGRLRVHAMRESKIHAGYMRLFISSCIFIRGCVWKWPLPGRLGMCYIFHIRKSGISAFYTKADKGYIPIRGESDWYRICAALDHQIYPHMRGERRRGSPLECLSAILSSHAGGVRGLFSKGLDGCLRNF